MMSRFHRRPCVFVSQVELIVGDLDRSLAFYQTLLGFRLLQKTDRRAVLTADGNTSLLSLEQPEDVIPKPPRTTGLYHFALLMPERTDLALVLKHLIDRGYPLQGASDHLVSEAIYLADPDGNGIELYADRPHTEWSWQNGEVVMATRALDLHGLLAEAQDKTWQGLPAETHIGHIHLHVADLEASGRFYEEGLGFDMVAHYGSQAMFLSSCGYHHHIGINTWNGVGVPTPPPNSVGLKTFTLLLPDSAAQKQILDRLSRMGARFETHDGRLTTRDPAGNRIRLDVPS